MTNVKKIEKIIDWTGVKIKKFKKLSKAVKYTPKYAEVWTCDFGQNLPGELSGVLTCVIAQNTKEVITAGSIVVLPIIRNSGKEYPTSVELDQDDVTPIDECHYIIGSILPHQITRVSKVRLGRKIGSVTEIGIEKIKRSLRLLMDI